MSVENRAAGGATNGGRSTLGRRPWKAALAVSAACGALLWHALACVESPMVFSPEGDLAFVAVGPAPAPAGGEDATAAEGRDGPGVYRLFVLPQGEKSLRVLEKSTEHLLCAPAYSPDGKSLCYLRVPVAELKRQKVAEPNAEDDGAEDGSPPGLISSEACEVEDLALPPTSEMRALFDDAGDPPGTEATLVVCDPASGEVRSTTGTRLRLPKQDEPSPNFWLYTLGKAQYGPEGDWIYVCAGRLLLAVHPGEKQVRLLAAPVWWASLSPDGTALATVAGEREIGIVAADGTRTLYTRLEPRLAVASPKGCTWLDDETVAVLAAREDGGRLLLVLLRRDGTTARRTELPIRKDDDWMELAVSPDGRRIAVACKSALHVVDHEGGRVAKWTEKGVAACSPAFSPDSKQLACKLIPSQGEKHCRAIALFSADGEEQSRVKVPQPGASAGR